MMVMVMVMMIRASDNPNAFVYLKTETCAERERATLCCGHHGCCSVRQGLFSCSNQGKVEVAGGGVPCGGAGRRGLTKMDTKLLEDMRKL